MPMDSPMPEMGTGDEMPGMNDGMPMDDMGGDEEMDGAPGMDGNADQKAIQELAGELSQKLGEYNDAQDEPDTETNKYVAGMINKQAGKALTLGDKKSVIKKLNGEDLGVEDGEDNGDAEMPEGGDEEMGGGMQQQQDPQQPQMPMEGKKSRNRLINEIVNSIFGDDDDELDRPVKTIRNKYLTPGNIFRGDR